MPISCWWHAFELQDDGSAGGDSARVVRRGRGLRERHTKRIADKSTTARGARYMALDASRKAQALGLRDECPAGKISSRN